MTDPANSGSRAWSGYAAGKNHAFSMCVPKVRFPATAAHLLLLALLRRRRMLPICRSHWQMHTADSERALSVGRR